MSESNHTTLGKVMPRWQNLWQELLRIVDLVPKLKDFIVSNNPDFSSLFNARQNIQTLPIYIIAHYLDPINLKVVIQDKH
jgi:hypothetical protein